MNDTIVAIATAHGIGSIAIIRLSGDNALEIAYKITKRSFLEPRLATLTSLYNTQNELIDEAIALYFQAPKSFTAQDVVEFQCHGGFIVAQMVLETALSRGARLATAGEFTKRAFLNGRIDMSEAEAIGKIIEAKSEDAAKILIKQLKGSLSEFVNDIRHKLLSIVAFAEVNIDYAEEDLPQDLQNQMQEKLQAIITLLDKTLQISKQRQGLIDGFKVAIIGKPNVGKSSVLNSLLALDRAIVSDIAGTTRDTIEENIKIKTHIIRIIDTAGIRETNNAIEKIGVRKSIEAIQEADLILALFDQSKEEDQEDQEILSLLKQHAKNKEVLIIHNKSDLETKFKKRDFGNLKEISLCAKESTFALIEWIEQILDKNSNAENMLLTSIKQIDAVGKTIKSMQEAQEPLSQGDLEIFTFNVQEAIASISEITKPYEIDQMFDEMFGSFCLGK